MLLRKNKPLVILLLAVVLSVAATIAATAGVIETRHFTVNYGEKDERDARRVATYAEDAFARISENLGYNALGDKRRVPVKVFSSRRDFLTETGIDRKKYIVGRAWSGSEQIEIDASGVFARVERIVAHEVTHVVVARILGPKVSALPLWANEGIAKVQAREWNIHDDDAVGEALSKTTFIPLENIAGSFPADNNSASLAYSQGASFVNYMQSKSGPDGLRRMLQHLAQTGDFEASVREVTGTSLARLESDWRFNIVQGYDANWIARNLPAVVGIAMALLCVLAYLAIKRKKRWNAAQWMIEDGYYDYEDDLDYGPPPE